MQGDHGVPTADRRITALLSVATAAVMLAGCGRFMPQDPNDAPWKTGGSTVVETQSANGPLAPACPTLAEARTAVPALVKGPDINTTVFKNMVLQCGYEFADNDVQGRPAGIGILVFDASAEGKTMWDSVKTDPSWGAIVDIPSLGDVADVAFASGTSGHNDGWVVKGTYAFHMSHLRQSGVPLDQLVALARAMLAGLARAG